MVDTTNSHTSWLVKDVFEKIQKRVSINKLQEGVKDESYHYKISDLLNYYIFHNLGLAVFTAKFYRGVEDKYLYDDFEKWAAVETMIQTGVDPEKFDEVYGYLADNASREIFDWLIQYRVAYAVIGPAAAKFFPFPAVYNHQIFQAAERKAKKRKGKFIVNDYLIDSTYFPIYEAWVIGSYMLEGKCEPEVRDLVISGGAFCGETALWLADRVGEQGKVYAFEPAGKYFSKLSQNIRCNGREKCIKAVAKGLWREDASINFTTKATSSFCSDQGDDRIEAVAVDSFVKSEGLAKVDLIKLDIEGAELNALKGAAETITRFKPKLMICLYHSPGDITEIPAYVKSLVPEYKLYLSHKFGNWYHTILFASIK